VQAVELAGILGRDGAAKPVLTGSIKTKSVVSSSENSLSTSLYGGAEPSHLPPTAPRRGPNRPRCIQTEEEPGHVERKRHRPIRARQAFACVRDIEDGGRRLVIFVSQQDRARADLVLNLLAADGCRVLRLDQLLLRFLGLILRGFLGGLLRGFLISSAGRWGGALEAASAANNSVASEVVAKATASRILLCIMTSLWPAVIEGNEKAAVQSRCLALIEFQFTRSPSFQTLVLEIPKLDPVALPSNAIKLWAPSIGHTRRSPSRLATRLRPFLALSPRWYSIRPPASCGFRLPRS